MERTAKHGRRANRTGGGTTRRRGRSRADSGGGAGAGESKRGSSDATASPERHTGKGRLRRERTGSSSRQLGRVASKSSMRSRGSFRLKPTRAPSSQDLAALKRERARLLAELGGSVTASPRREDPGAEASSEDSGDDVPDAAALIVKDHETFLMPEPIEIVPASRALTRHEVSVRSEQTPKAVVAARLGMIDDLLAALKTRKASQADACAALIAGMHKGQARIIRPVAPYCSRETLGRALVTAATHGKRECVIEFIAHCLAQLPPKFVEEALSAAAGSENEEAGAYTVPALATHCEQHAVDRALSVATQRNRYYNAAALLPKASVAGLDRALAAAVAHCHTYLLALLLDPSEYTETTVTPKAIARALAAAALVRASAVTDGSDGDSMTTLRMLRDVAAVAAVDHALQVAARDGNVDAVRELRPSSTNSGRARVMAAASSNVAAVPACAYVVEELRPHVRRYSAITTGVGGAVGFGDGGAHASLAARGAAIVSGVLGGALMTDTDMTGGAEEAVSPAPRRYNAKPRDVRARRHSAVAGTGAQSLVARRVLASVLG